MQEFSDKPVHECRIPIFIFILNQLRVTLISHYHKRKLKCIRMQIESLGSLENRRSNTCERVLLALISISAGYKKHELIVVTEAKMYSHIFIML